MPLIIKAIEEIRLFGKYENDLYTAAKTPGTPEKTGPAVDAALAQLFEKKKTVEAALGQASKAGLFEGGPELLAAAYERLFRELNSRYETARAIEEQIDEMLSATTLGAVKQVVASVVGEKKETIIFREIREKLKGVLAEMETRFKGTLSDAELAELRTLDELHLADPQTGARRYETRWNLYKTSVEATKGQTYAQSFDLIGQDWKPLTDLIAQVEEIRKEVQTYQGVMRDKTLTICGYCLSNAERIHSDEFCKVYLNQARSKGRASLRFPLVGSPSDLQNPLSPGDLVPAVNLVDRIKHDLESPAFHSIKSGQLQPLVDLRKNLNKLDPIIEALLTPDKQLRLVTILLMSRNEQFRLSGQQVAMDAFKEIELRVGTILHATPVKRGAIGRIASASAGELELGKFRLDEPFHFHFYRTSADSAPAVDKPEPENWTALRLLDQQHARPIGDGRRWQFPLQPATGKLLWFEFRFDTPLPEFDNWPTLQSIGLDAPLRR